MQRICRDLAAVIALAQFPQRQTGPGYFRSQAGERDSNCQVLWIAERFHSMTARKLSPDWLRPLPTGDC